MPACSSCHGVKGEGHPDMPSARLAGLNAGYIIRQLDSFADGTPEERHDGTRRQSR